MPVPRRIVMPPWSSVAAVAAGGAVGAALRYVFTVLFPTDPGRFPLTTFAENVLGAFLLGLVMILILERWRPVPHLQPFVCTGVLGSFTTFSNFTFELVELGRTGHALVGVVYAGASIIAGLIAGLLGIAAARSWPPWIAKET